MNHVQRMTFGVALLAALSGTALAQPANNALSNATVVSVPTSGSASVAGTLVAASNDAPISGACGSSTSSPDVWYRFDADTTTGVDVSTCGSASWDTVLQAFELNTNGTLGTQVACVDDSCGTQTLINFAATAGRSYVVRVASFNNGAGGAFTLSLSRTVPPPPPPPRAVGPDVVVGELSDVGGYGTGTALLAGAMTGTQVRSFAIGTSSWNIGDRPLDWFQSTQLHPAIGQQIYRVKDGVFEQIGMSWLKHGFASVNGNQFPLMGPCVSPPSGGAQLGVNCSDPYGSGLNSSRSYLGPRFDVNATTGVFTYPWNPLVGTFVNSDVAARRLLVRATDVDASNNGAIFYGETVYVTQDDAQFNNGRNNYSSARLGTIPTGTGGWPIAQSTQIGITALDQFAANSPGTRLADVDMLENVNQVTNKYDLYAPGDGTTPLLPSAQWTTSMVEVFTRFKVASTVVNNGNGTWTYQYQVMNLNSHRSADKFQVRLPANAVVSNVSMKYPFYHSGDRVRNVAWTNTNANGILAWDVDPATEVVNVTGLGNRTYEPNAIRWSTMYTFMFTANVPPRDGATRLSLWRAPASTTIGYQGGDLLVTGIDLPAICKGDVGQQGGIAGPDGALDNNDFAAFIDAFFGNNLLVADVGSQGGVVAPDNTLDNNDFAAFIAIFFEGCL